MTMTPVPGSLSYAALSEQEWAAYWDRELARQQQLLTLETAHECWQCRGTTEGSTVGWICDTCRMSRGNAS
jgi:hypothetical protein